MTARTVAAGVKVLADVDMEFHPESGNRSDIVTFEDGASRVRVVNRDTRHPQLTGKIFFTVNGSEPNPRTPGTFEVRGALHAETTVPAPAGPVTVRIASVAWVPVQAQNLPWPSGHGPGGRRYAIS